MQEMQETWVQFLGWEDPLEEDMAAHSSILAWRIPWTEELGGLRSIAYQSQQDWGTEHTSKFTWFKTDQKHRKVMKKLSPNLPILESPNPFWGGGEECPQSIVCPSRKKEVTQLCPTLCESTDCSPPRRLLMEFSRQEYWSELPFPSSEDRPNPGTEPRSPALQAVSFFTVWATKEALSF